MLSTAQLTGCNGLSGQEKALRDIARAQVERRRKGRLEEERKASRGRGRGRGLPYLSCWPMSIVCTLGLRALVEAIAAASRVFRVKQANKVQERPCRQGARGRSGMVQLPTEPIEPGGETLFLAPVDLNRALPRRQHHFFTSIRTTPEHPQSIWLQNGNC
jgi:hypothetical protein